MTVAVGLVGYGLAGAVFHTPLIRAVDRLSLAAIATSRRVLDGVNAVSDPHVLVADPAIDLVVIAAPNLHHYPLARAALEAGKHVVVDKPFTVTVAQADELIALAQARGRLLTVFHNRRWDGDFLTASELIGSGKLGDVKLCEMNWDRFRPAIKRGWREVPGEGAGLLNDLGPHLVDQAVQWFGMPDAVAGDLAVQREQAPVDDYFQLVLRYGARRVVLSASTLAASARPRFALHGTGGSFVKFGLDPQEASLKAAARPGDRGFGEDDPRLYGTLTGADGSTERVPTRPGRYLGFYEGVAAAVLDAAPPPVDSADARDGLRIIALARRSAREGHVLCL